MASVPPEQQCTSSITFGELVYGARRLGTSSDALMERIQDLVLRAMPVLPFDVRAARHYGRLRADLERRGLPLADADLRIASIALERQLTVVTQNVRHFARVPGLSVENWLA